MSIELVITNQVAFDDRPRLSPEKKEAWLKALRSGEYKKGKKVLATRAKDKPDFSYCCLGVLCEVEKTESIIAKIGEDFVKHYHGNSNLYPAIGESYGTLSDVGDFIGFYVQVPSYSANNLAGVNDHTESFAEVIEVIEKYF